MSAVKGYIFRMTTSAFSLGMISSVEKQPTLIPVAASMYFKHNRIVLILGDVNGLDNEFQGDKIINSHARG